MATCVVCDGDTLGGLSVCDNADCQFEYDAVMRGDGGDDRGYTDELEENAYFEGADERYGDYGSYEPSEDGMCDEGWHDYNEYFEG